MKVLLVFHWKQHSQCNVHRFFTGSVIYSVISSVHSSVNSSVIFSVTFSVISSVIFY